MSLRAAHESRINVVRKVGEVFAMPVLQHTTCDRELPIDHTDQGNFDNWCWVACLHMLFEKDDSNARRCRFAREALSMKCCYQWIKKKCDKKLPLARVVDEWNRWFSHYRGASPPTILGIGKLSFAQVVHEIDQDRPVQLLIHGSLTGTNPPTGIGHLVLVVGYLNADQADADKTLLIHDPANGYGFKQSAFDYVDGSLSWVAYWTPLVLKV